MNVWKSETAQVKGVQAELIPHCSEHVKYCRDWSNGEWLPYQSVPPPLTHPNNRPFFLYSASVRPTTGVV